MKEEFALCDLFYSVLELEIFLQYDASFYAVSSTTMESLPPKVMDFGLQKPTGPSSGVAASILSVSPGLDCS